MRLHVRATRVEVVLNGMWPRSLDAELDVRISKDSHACVRASIEADIERIVVSARSS